MSRISRRSLIAVVLLAAMLTVLFAVPLQAAVFKSPPAYPHAYCNGWYYRVLPGDTLSRIGVRYGVSVNNLVRCNGLPNANRIYAGQLLLIPRGGYAPPPPPYHPTSCGAYRVRWGDTLSRIAARYHTSVWYLVRLNGLPNANRIYSGQVLRVPCYR